MAFEAVLADTCAGPVYQQIAPKALHLKDLGLGSRKIAKHLGVRREMVLKALAWIVRQRRSESFAY
jgi:hypothetical protein